MSKFGMKTGFVIPKNKLSGSLVPAFRGAAKAETDTLKQETNKQIQRKTKWGTDLTQDADVRRGRALAYQIRVDQITKQLELGALEKVEKDHSSELPNEVPNGKSPRHQPDDQKLEMLKLEKREIIGEILKLNSSYKAPLDYEPLMKEASVPVPVKLYPGLNFVGLILGPGSNTQKRLEEETGARIRVHATKAGSGEKVEITSSDKNEAQGAYEELYVHVSADTHEKVDAAVGLIELLVTPVSGRSATVPLAPTSASGDTVNVLEQTQDATSSNVMPSLVINQGAMQSLVGPVQHGFHPQVQYHQYSAPWFPSGQMHPPNSFAPPSNSSAPIPNNVIQFPQNHSNVPQFMVRHPPSPAGSGLSAGNPSLGSPRLQQPMQGYQWPHYREAPPNSQGPPQRVHPFPSSQPHLNYPNMSGQANLTIPQQGMVNQPWTTGPGPGPRPGPFPSAPAGQPPNMQWSASTGPAAQSSMFQRPPVNSHSLMSSGAAPSNVPANAMSGASGNMISHSNFPPRPSTGQQLPNTPGNHPGTGPNFSFVIHQRSPFAPNPVPQTSMPGSLPSSMPPSTLAPAAPSSMMPPPMAAPAPSSSSFNQSSSGAHMPPARLQGPMPNQSMIGAVPVPPPQPSVNQNNVPVGSPSFTSPNPPINNPQTNIPATTPIPPRPSSGDFTFQPLGSPSQTVSRPLPAPSVLQNSTMQPPLAPQTPTSRPAVQNLGPQHVMQDFSGTRPQMVQSPSHSQVRPPLQSFSGNPSPTRPPPRFPEFPNQNPYPPPASAPHVGPQSFTQGPQMPNFPRQYPPQMMNPPHLQQNQPGPTIHPGGFVPNQQYGGRQVFSPNSNQVYDPFSPTSAASAPQQPGTPSKVRKQEDDPEYDDLMASVGVR